MTSQILAEAVGVAAVTGLYMWWSGVDGLVGDALSLQGGLGVALGYAGGQYLAHMQKNSTIQMVAPLAGAVAVPAALGAGINPIFALTAWAGCKVAQYVYKGEGGAAAVY